MATRIYLAYLLALYLAYLLAFYLAVEVQRCTLSWEGPRLRSSDAHWARKVPGWGPAVHIELGRSQVEVQRCTLSWEVGKELGEELARRKLRWKLMQTWSRRNRRRRRRRRRRRKKRRRKRRRRASRGGEEQLWYNLTTLTWQVGNNLGTSSFFCYAFSCFFLFFLVILPVSLFVWGICFCFCFVFSLLKCFFSAPVGLISLYFCCNLDWSLHEFDSSAGFQNH